MSRSYWLIEKQEQVEDRWLRVIVDEVLGRPRARFDWTNAAIVALAFHRKEDALAFVVLNPELCAACYATEHVTMEAK